MWHAARNKNDVSYNWSAILGTWCSNAERNPGLSRLHSDEPSSKSVFVVLQCWLNMLLHRVVRLLLGILQGSIPEHLACEFELPQAVPQALALRACGMLSKDLIVVLLSPALRLGSAAVRKDALRLLRTVRWKAVHESLKCSWSRGVLHSLLCRAALECC